MIFAPLFEEMFFRGTLYQNVRKYSGWSMMLISGLTFGLWHANFPQFLTASVMGVFSCFLIEKTGSIFPSMTVHFIINSIGSFTTILTSKVGITSQNIASQDIFTETMSKNPFTMIAIALIGLLIIIFLIIWLVLMIVEITCHPESFRIENRKNGISGGKAFIIYMTSPLMIITMLGMLALTVTRALGIWL